MERVDRIEMMDKAGKTDKANGTHKSDKARQKYTDVDMTGKRRRILMGVAVVIPLFCYFIFCITGRIYDYTDNVTVGVVVGGMYSNNNFCQYLHPFLCLIIKLLNPLFPTADLFEGLIHIALIYGAVLLSYIGLESLLRKPFKKWQVEDFIQGALFLLSVAYFMLGMFLFGVNYTVQTAAIILEGFITLFYARDKGRFWIISGTVLMCFGYLIRLEAALLFIPFIGLEIVATFVRSDNKREHIRKDLRTIAPGIILVLVILGSKFAFNAVEPYASNARYNKYRTVAEDYVMHTYSPAVMKDTGIDESTYNVVRDWILVDTDRLNVDTIETIATKGSQPAYLFNKSGFKNTMRHMWSGAFKTDLHIIILTALVIILTLRNVIFLKGIWLKLESAFAFIGGFIILVYFTFMGRALVRVWQCVLLAAIAVQILTMIHSAVENSENAKDEDRKSRRKTGKRAVGASFQLFLCVILYFGIGQVMAVSHFHSFQTPFTARINQNDSMYEETFADDTLYIWPSWYSAIPEYFSKQNKLPTQRVIDHNVAIGDWTYEQQYFIDFLERVNARNLAIALLERPNTYLVDGQTKEFLWYMREHYGEDIELQQVSKIDGRKVFKLVRRGDTDDIYEGELDKIEKEKK